MGSGAKLEGGRIISHGFTRINTDKAEDKQAEDSTCLLPSYLLAFSWLLSVLIRVIRGGFFLYLKPAGRW